MNEMLTKRSADMKNIPFGRPEIGDEERAAVMDVMSGSQLVHGPRAKEFERQFAERIGVAHAISVSSCTAGLHLGLHVHEVGPGDTVIVPALTHVATAHAVEYCKAKPIFADVLPNSGNIDPDAVQAAITGETRAIIPVHYLGLPCDMDRLLKSAKAAGAFVMEDCALAVDAAYGERKAGGLGLMGCFSFYPVKHITTAEGGMLTTNDSDVAALVARLKAFGYDRGLGERKVPGLYDVVGLGYNYRMSEVHAAIGLAQLAKLDEFQKRRAENYAALQRALADLDEITVFEPTQGKAVSSHYCLNAVLPRDGSIDRAQVIAHLNQNGVGSSIHYPGPVPLFAYYREKYGYKRDQFPVAQWLAEQTISLPVGPHVKADDVSYIADKFKEALLSARL